jgi:RsiW-degrading membrane proteinase PrsW (M82 family)
MILELIEKYPYVLAFILGLAPALIWMWFWLKEDTHPEPAKMVTLSFLGGMLAVLFVLPLQKLVYDHFYLYENLSFFLWAALEELSKFGFVYLIALRFKKFADEPIDDIIYLIISSLGFVTLENTLFLMDPIQNGNFASTIINGNLRFVGASLLHTISSATIGICMGLSFYKSRAKKFLYTLSGILIAIILHTSFNLFIIREAEGNIFLVFGMVRLSIIVLLLLFEKVKHIQKTTTL